MTRARRRFAFALVTALVLPPSAAAQARPSLTPAVTKPSALQVTKPITARATRPALPKAAASKPAEVKPATKAPAPKPAETKPAPATSAPAKPVSNLAALQTALDRIQVRVIMTGRGIPPQATPNVAAPAAPASATPSAAPVVHKATRPATKIQLNWRQPLMWPDELATTAATPAARRITLIWK